MRATHYWVALISLGITFLSIVYSFMGTYLHALIFFGYYLLFIGFSAPKYVNGKNN